MSQTTRITALGLGLAASALALTGCSAESDAATEAAQKFVAGTFREQCEMTHPVRGGAARDCENRADEPVWPGHPTEVTATTEWKGNGYAVVIPNAKGEREVYGMRLDGETWKVAEFDRIEPEDDLTADPACSALDTTGEGC